MTASANQPVSGSPAAAPPDWRLRWNQPLNWPGVEQDLPDDSLARHAAYRPELAQCVLVPIDVDKKALDRQIQRLRRQDPSAGEALARQMYDVVLPNIIRLVERFRGCGRPVVFVQWGWHRYQYPPLEPRAGEDVVIKQSRGAFATSNLDQVLKRHGCGTCVFAGADLAYCVASTVRGAIDRGYRSVLVEDACVSAIPGLREATLASLGHGQAHVLRTSQIMELADPPRPR
jgi:nicotinamidase-related amidase